MDSNFSQIFLTPNENYNETYEDNIFLSKFINPQKSNENFKLSKLFQSKEIENNNKFPNTFNCNLNEQNLKNTNMAKSNQLNFQKFSEKLSDNPNNHTVHFDFPITNNSSFKSKIKFSPKDKLSMIKDSNLKISNYNKIFSKYEDPLNSRINLKKNKQLNLNDNLIRTNLLRSHEIENNDENQVNSFHNFPNNNNNNSSRIFNDNNSPLNKSYLKTIPNKNQYPSNLKNSVFNESYDDILKKRYESSLDFEKKLPKIINHGKIIEKKKILSNKIQQKFLNSEYLESPISIKNSKNPINENLSLTNNLKDQIDNEIIRNFLINDSEKHPTNKSLHKNFINDNEILGKPLIFINKYENYNGNYVFEKEENIDYSSEKYSPLKKKSHNSFNKNEINIDEIRNENIAFEEVKNNLFSEKINPLKTSKNSYDKNEFMINKYENENLDFEEKSNFHSQINSPLKKSKVSSKKELIFNKSIENNNPSQDGSILMEKFINNVSLEQREEIFKYILNFFFSTYFFQGDSFERVA